MHDSVAILDVQRGSRYMGNLGEVTSMHLVPSSNIDVFKFPICRSHGQTFVDLSVSDHVPVSGQLYTSVGAAVDSRSGIS